MKFGILLLLVVASLAVVRSSEDHKALNEKQHSILIKSLDKDYRPCADFYRYACYKWSDQHKDNGDNYTTVPEMMNYDINMEVIEYLEKTPETDMPGFVKLVKDFYVSCTESPEFKPLDFMHWMEKEEHIKWALFTPDAAEDFVFDWTKILATFRKYGFNNMFITESRHYQEGSHFITYLKKPMYSDGFNFVFNYEIDEYNETIPLPSGTMGFHDLWKYIDPFEDKLRDIKVEEQEKPKMFKYHELPYPWMQSYLKYLMEPEVIDPNMEVGIDNMAYMKALDSLLKEYDAKVLVRYMEIRFLQDADKFNKRATKNECMTTTKSLLPMAVEWIYEQMHPEIVKEMPKIEQMFENILKNVNKSLHMDVSEYIPKEFFGKLETMHMKVGMIPQENAKDLLESYYADVKLDAHEYYRNFVKMLEFYYKLEHTHFDYKNFAEDKGFFFKTPSYNFESSIRPIYVPSMNLMILPFGLFRPPVYHEDFEDIFKQSSLATIMGMGMFDAFLSTKDFPNEDVKKLAGVIGLHAAFEVFFSSLQSEEISRYLTMFGFTSLHELKQMFFLNAIHYKCEWYSGDADIVNFATSNLSDFTEAYDCKLNNFMRMF
uniref:Peptidase family M13 n=1 Tax=Musca domestica TaxID=7370 RepID=T1PD52_MUSDO